MQFKAFALSLAALLAVPLLAAPGPVPVGSFFSTAPQLVNPEKAAIYAAALAGTRIVAVGDYGLINLSEDGKTFRQAKVPTRAPLTSVFFIDARQGWAVGHDGMVLGSVDGGESWQVLRDMRGKDQVLMSVWFENAEHGLAIGQFGLALETRDGGKSWSDFRVANQDVYAMAVDPKNPDIVYAGAWLTTPGRSGPVRLWPTAAC